MRCLYFDGKKCTAKPNLNSNLNYEPTNEEQEKYCNNTLFVKCPRYAEVLKHVIAFGKSG